VFECIQLDVTEPGMGWFNNNVLCSGVLKIWIF